MAGTRNRNGLDQGRFEQDRSRGRNRRRGAVRGFLADGKGESESAAAARKGCCVMCVMCAVDGCAGESAVRDVCVHEQYMLWSCGTRVWASSSAR